MNILNILKISALHTIAKGFEYQDFVKAMSVFKPSVIDCIKYPDLRIKVLAMPLLINKKFLYKVMKRF